MSTDILYPLLIGGGCLVIGVMVHLSTRPKPSRADITLPAVAGGSGAGVTSVGNLSIWHRTHESAVLAFVDLVDGGPGGQTLDEVSEALDRAIDDHPAPDMRAELAALRTAGQAMSAALDRDDGETAARHLEIYRDYRHAWLDRLWQFPIDELRVSVARRRNEDDLDTGGQTRLPRGSNQGWRRGSP